MPDERSTDFGFQRVPLTEKARRVRGVFDSVADRYDLMNDLMSAGAHRLWKRFTLALANLRPGQRALDVAGGTGDLAAGLARLFFGAKGIDYYVANTFFWIKMSLFVAVGVVSVAPTMSFILWRRRVRNNASYRPPVQEVARLRKALYAEAALFALIPISAAAMARGYGM